MVEPSVPLTIIIAPVLWIWRRAMPRPEFSLDLRRCQWSDVSEAAQWMAAIRLRKGLFWWKNKIDNCRLYLIRRDFGRLDSAPEGIWLKWIENGQQLAPLGITMVAGKSYEAVVIVRDSRESTAYIANERFIETRGVEKRWPLSPGRDFPPNDPVGRYTFWLEIGVGRKRWRSEHYYVAHIPPAKVGNDDFRLQILYERTPA